MRKIFPALVVLLILGAFANLLFPNKKEDLNRLFSPPSSGRSQPKASPPAAAANPQPSSPAILRTASGGILFEQLFPVSRWQRWLPQETVTEAQARFAQPYPAAARAHLYSPRDLEIADRVGILKALGRGLKSDAGDAFFHGLARNSKEPLLVRRQALENLRPALARMSERERAATLKDLPPLLVSLADRSEGEILRGIWGYTASRHTASDAKGGSLNVWENLPCPSQEEFTRLARGVNWQGAEEYVCDQSNLGKLGRSLLLLSKLSLSFPHHSPLATNLARPYEFLAKRSKLLKINLEQKDTVAYNRAGEINLGPIFFADSPLSSLAVLIHEARHTDKDDQGHTICIQGDIPQMPGGCDHEFTDQDHAGAYSYGVFYNLSLARSGSVSAADREFLETAALAETSTRFNKLLPEFARFQDVIAGLDGEGRLKLLHPFVSRAFSPLNERIQRISYEDKTGGLYLLDGKSAGFSWRLGRKPEPFQPKAVPAGTVVQFIGKFRQHFRPYPHTSFLDERNKIHFLDFDAASGERRAYPHPLPLPGRLDSFFSASIDMSLVFTEEGYFYRLRQWGNDKDFNPLHEESGPFRHGSGGILKDTLFAIRADGRLFRQQAKEVFPEGSNQDYGILEYSLHSSAFTTPVPGRQFEEGTSLRAMLDESGDLWLSRLGEEAPKARIAGFKLKSFAFMKAMESSLVKPARPDLSAFERACGVKSAIIDPWLSRGVGLADGRLIFEGEGGACWPADLDEGLQGKIIAFSFESASFGPAGEASNYFAPTRLTITLVDGRKREISPYVR